MAQKVAEQVVDMLVDTGVKRIYAVTGDSLNEINDAVRRNEKIDWIHVRHEETGAFAAGAEAQITGNIACCAGSSGPGHVHLINGIYDAHRSNAPVIAIASTIATHEFGTKYFQETNTIKLLQRNSDNRTAIAENDASCNSNSYFKKRRFCHRVTRRLNFSESCQHRFF